MKATRGGREKGGRGDNVRECERALEWVRVREGAGIDASERGRERERERKRARERMRARERESVCV